MQSRHLLTVLAARNLPALATFYTRVFSWVPTVDTETYYEFELPGGQRIGLYERESFGRNFGETPADLPAGAVRPFELYLQVTDLAIAQERILDADGRLLSAAAKREWGDEVAYFADPEGNVLALVAVKEVKPPIGNYTRDAFVRRVADVVLRSGVEDAQTLVRDLENAVHFPMLARCGIESALHWGARCVLLPGHKGYCESARGARWTRMASSSDE